MEDGHRRLLRLNAHLPGARGPGVLTQSCPLYRLEEVVDLDLVEDRVVSFDHQATREEEGEAVAYKTSLNSEDLAGVCYVLDPKVQSNT